MTVRPDRPAAADTVGCEHDDLLFCRMAILGLDLDAIEQGDRKTFNELEQRCWKCDSRGACEIDLVRDPNNPVWETYCPNSALLNVLPGTWWLPR
jgi:hypothetical protein